jgi:signal transduction histidine kinase
MITTPALGLKSSSPVQSSGEVSGVHRGPVSVLLVDDEARNLDALESVLDNPEYHLVRAQDAEQALLALIQTDFAVIVLDVRMPNMSGLQLAQVIKQRKKTQHIPIIFLTAYYQEDEHMIQGYGAGAVDYLNKPFNPVVMRSKVAVFVDLYRKTRALESEIAGRKRLEAEIAEVAEREQRRLGQELHDGLGQQMVGIGYMISALLAKLEKASPSVTKEAERLQHLITESVEKARMLAKGFYPVELERRGLFVALQEIARGAEQLHPVSSVVESDESSCAQMNDQVAVQIFRIAQEAVHNVIKHAQAKKIAISLATVNGDIVLTVKDDGIGFPPNADEKTGMGLQIMQYRAQMIGGRVDFRNDPDGGAVITCTAPRQEQSTLSVSAESENASKTRAALSSSASSQ